MSKPVIGITTAEHYVSFDGAPFPRKMTGLNSAYVQLAVQASCVPLLLSHQGAVSNCDQLISFLDALILIGGADIDSKQYGQESKVHYDESLRSVGKAYHRPRSFAPDSKRDDFEFAMYEKAKQKKIPVFGICRGFQLINVAEGGTLHQENPESSIEHFMHEDGWIPYHSVTLPQGTLTRNWMEVETYMTSSLHHQSIHQLATSLVPTSFADDGLIESFEWIDSEHFILGVQGHIEHTYKNLPLHGSLLRHFFLKASEGVDDESRNECSSKSGSTLSRTLWGTT
jgi:putative glutamine amidotransferase